MTDWHTSDVWVDFEATGDQRVAYFSDSLKFVERAPGFTPMGNDRSRHGHAEDMSRTDRARLN